MESTSYWLVFFTTVFVINISPGPDVIYIVSRTIAQGRKVGIASSLGIWSGALVHVAAAALGLSAVLAASATAFAIVKYIGAAYLVYLGIRSLMSDGETFNMHESTEDKTTVWKAFRQGVLVDILNPKVAIFFMAFLPQFIRPELGHHSAQIAVLGFLVILVAVPIEFFFVITADRTTSFFRKNRRCSFWLERISGSILVSLGIRLAFTENSNA
ncbi:LysE family translocator [Desulfobacter curvatus]|uniref:LysE family translocator n=1 Tax=Desulfobacter curvatus TaxID=2290 RepID=UPI000372D4DD|nr:LysE family translocator [Desulfobacter curvatus]